MKINGLQNLKYIKKNFLFCGKSDDKYSLKIINFLKKKKILFKFILTSSKNKLTKKEKNLIYSNNFDFYFYLEVIL